MNLRVQPEGDGESLGTESFTLLTVLFLVLFQTLLDITAYSRYNAWEDSREPVMPLPCKCIRQGSLSWHWIRTNPEQGKRCLQGLDLVKAHDSFSNHCNRARFEDQNFKRNLALEHRQTTENTGKNEPQLL